MYPRYMQKWHNQIYGTEAPGIATNADSSPSSLNIAAGFNVKKYLSVRYALCRCRASLGY